MLRLTKNLVVMIIVMMTVASLARAEDDTTYTYTWKKSLIADVLTTQTSYSNSWVGGEAGSFNWVANLNGQARKKFNEWFRFKTTLRMSFGQTMIQDAETKDWSRPKKSTDLIDWENIGYFTHSDYIEPYLAFRLESQFVDQSVRIKKRYLSPMKLTESGGIARNFYEKGDDLVTSRLGLALRQIIRTDISDTATLRTETNTFTDGGLESVTDLILTLNTKLTYVGKITLFKAFFFSKKDEVKGTPAEDYWKAIDVNWENILNAQLSKILTVQLYTQLLYDKEISLKGRFKETMGIGFVFKLM